MSDDQRHRVADYLGNSDTSEHMGTSKYNFTTFFTIKYREDNLHFHRKKTHFGAQVCRAIFFRTISKITPIEQGADKPLSYSTLYAEESRFGNDAKKNIFWATWGVFFQNFEVTYLPAE